jgi:hypothetical protein
MENLKWAACSCNYSVMVVTAPGPVKAHVLVITVLQKIDFDNLKTQQLHIYIHDICTCHTIFKLKGKFHR